MSSIKISTDLGMIDAFALLEQVRLKSLGQLEAVKQLVEDLRPQIKSSIIEGLNDEKAGPYIALKLLKLEQEMLISERESVTKLISYKQPLEASQQILAIGGQIFHCIKEWMRINNLDHITLESVNDLEDYVILEVLTQNGFRHYNRVTFEADVLE